MQSLYNIRFIRVSERDMIIKFLIAIFNWLITKICNLVPLTKKDNNVVVEQSEINIDQGEHFRAEENCQWHNEIQSCIKEITELIKNHEVKVFNEEETQKSEEWNVRFQNGPKKGKSMWEKIKTFYCKPSIFQLKELQKLVEEDIKKNYPNESIREMVNATIAKIESQVRNDYIKNGTKKKIREELKRKFPKEPEDII